MTSTTTTGTTKVPWTEINAALGHVVLLLDLLVDRCGWTITHQLVPMASASQIGIRRPVRTLFGTINAHHPPLLQPPVFTNLYYCEEGSFSLFKGSALRQFHIGLGALLECVVEIAQSDKTIVLPHAICLPTGTIMTSTLSSSSSSTTTLVDGSNNKNTNTTSSPATTSTTNTTTITTIGGVPMVFGETADFTRACKYLLTDVKWLVAYAVKHHMA